MTERLLTLDDVAERCRVSKRTLQDVLDKHPLEYVIVGKRKRFTENQYETLKSVIEEFQDSRNHPLMRLRWELREQAEPNIGYVYFIAAGTRAIKIGWAKNPEWRLSNLQVANFEELSLIAACYGSSGLERAVHKKFRSYHIRGEWFRYRKPILTFAALVAAENAPLPTMPDASDE